MARGDAELIQAAMAVRDNPHAPYSGFHVGAAILADDGEVYVGCNVENAAYPEGSCAETMALGAMVAGGGKKALVVAVAGGFREGGLQPCTPCGGCRQRILEFAAPDTVVVTRDAEGRLIRRGIGELLPSGFTLR